MLKTKTPSKLSMCRLVVMLEDPASYRVAERPVISTPYRGYEVQSMVSVHAIVQEEGLFHGASDSRRPDAGTVPVH
jgi:gamma-glutamyltranspeptidase